jgi:hypothetical protein
MHCRDTLIDDQMTIHGSMWFMPLAHFYNRLQGLDKKISGTFVGEPHEIALKTWLGGGRVIINKNTWYAHLQSRAAHRGYRISLEESYPNYKLLTDYWLENKWEDRIYDFDWLIEKFWPLPHWPKNWRDYYDKEQA